MLRYPRIKETIPQLSDQELARLIARCEDAITHHKANIEEYEAFVLASHERAQRHKVPVGVDLGG